MATLFLHGFDNPNPDARFLEPLSHHAAVIAPSHSGFGASTRPVGFEMVYDPVHLCCELIDCLPGAKVALIQTSFGGWLAAEQIEHPLAGNR